MAWGGDHFVLSVYQNHQQRISHLGVHVYFGLSFTHNNNNHLLILLPFLSGELVFFSCAFRFELDTSERRVCRLPFVVWEGLTSCCRYSSRQTMLYESIVLSDADDLRRDQAKQSTAPEYGRLEQLEVDEKDERTRRVCHGALRKMNPRPFQCSTFRAL